MSFYKILVAFAILTTLVVGNATYFFGLNQAVWIPYLVGFALFVIFFKSVMPRHGTLIPLKIVTSITPLVLLYLVSILLSAIINVSPAVQVLTGVKSFVALWSVYFVVAFCAVRLEKVERLIMWILPLSVIQVPFVLYEYFFIASTRSTAGGADGVAWDAVVGTFGGDPMGGGASGVLAFVDAFAMVLALALWSRGQLNLRMLTLVMLSCVLCISLAEVKVIVVLLPLGVTVLGIFLFKERPTLVVSMVGFSILSVIGLLIWYGAQYSVGAQSGDGSVGYALDSAFGYSLDSMLINFETRELGRMAAVDFWWTNGFMQDFFHGVFGYGPGASRSSSAIQVGEVAAKYPFFNIDRSSAVQALWDIGLVGFLILCAILLRGYKSAYKLSKLQLGNPMRRSILEAIGSMLLMALVMMPYSRDFFEVPAMAFIVIFCLGYVNQVSQSPKNRA